MDCGIGDAYCKAGKVDVEQRAADLAASITNGINSGRRVQPLTASEQSILSEGVMAAPDNTEHLGIKITFSNSHGAKYGSYGYFLEANRSLVISTKGEFAIFDEFTPDGNNTLGAPNNGSLSPVQLQQLANATKYLDSKGLTQFALPQVGIAVTIGLLGGKDFRDLGVESVSGVSIPRQYSDNFLTVDWYQSFNSQTGQPGEVYGADIGFSVGLPAPSSTYMPTYAVLRYKR